MGWLATRALAERAVTTQLGQAVTYTPAAGAAETVNGVWVDDAEDVQIVDGVPVISPATRLELWIADLTQTPASGDTCTVGATTYTIAEVRVAGGIVVCKVLR